jgi:hypothetical protein
MELIAYYIYGSLCLLFGLALGYYWRGWEDRHAGKPRTDEPITYTQGAAYDAMEDSEPETDHDAVARRILNSW